jgi:uncharacterized SAM-binding protein YcdF (DUF218 family)
MAVMYRISETDAMLLWLASTRIASGQLVKFAERWRDRLPTDAIARRDAVMVPNAGYRDAPGTLDASASEKFDRLLADEDLSRADKALWTIVVTSAFHMTRAESLLRAAGLDVTPLPVDFRGPMRIALRSFFPSDAALAQTDLALHETYGRVYYWLRGLVVGPGS